VRAPTIVLHCRGDTVVLLEDGRELAALIPYADFVPWSAETTFSWRRSPLGRYSSHVANLWRKGHKRLKVCEPLELPKQRAVGSVPITRSETLMRPFPAFVRERGRIGRRGL